jgi:Domain of unknown function (DUF1707)
MSADLNRPTHAGEGIVPEPHDVRTSDAERDVVVEALRGHAASGRLDPEELEQRLERAYAARVRADLVPLVADLPAPPRPAPARERTPFVLPDFAPVVAIAVLLIAIWALSGGGYFWPVWPIGALALSSFKHRRGACLSVRSSPRPR